MDLFDSYRGDDAPSWAIAGRSTDKLQKVRADIGAPDDLPLVKADAAEPAICRACGKRGADVRPDFNWKRKAVKMMGYR